MQGRLVSVRDMHKEDFPTGDTISPALTLVVPEALIVSIIGCWWWGVAIEGGADGHSQLGGGRAVKCNDGGCMAPNRCAVPLRQYCELKRAATNENENISDAWTCTQHVHIHNKATFLPWY